MNLELKKTALRIHALSKKDQKWIMSELPYEVREDVQIMLDQLKRFGIPKDQTWMDVAREEIEGEPENKSDELIKVVDKMNISEVKDVLDGLAEHVLVAILSIYPWAWRAQYLSKLKGKYRTKYEREMSNVSGKLSTKMQNSLLSTLIKKVAPDFFQAEDVLSLKSRKQEYNRFVQKWSSLWQQ